MGASSKKKGKQRKAAARKALSAEASGGGVSSSSISGVGVSSGGINKIVAKVRSGDNKVMKKLLNASGRANLSLVSYEHSGILSVVLEFLNRCEDETYEEVMNSVGGDLKSPLLWIRVLVAASHVEPSSKLQIAKNIGPLVRCMVNDTERRFFKSNKHWKEAILKFFNLVANVIELREKQLESMQIVEALLQHEGLLRFIIQMGFWREYRPDIVKLLKSEGMTFSGTVLDSRVLIDILVSGMEGESRIRLLETIGTSPIVNKEYNSACMTSCVAGLVCQLKDDTLLGTPYIKEGNFIDQRKSIFGVLQRLVIEADCVDKGFIIELIDLGTNYSSHHETAIYVALLSLEMIHQGAPEKKQLRGDIISDTRSAFAIREGLIEMCLAFIECFSKHESFGEDGGLYEHIKQVFRSIYLVLLHKKTAKAITNKRNVIEGQLVCLEQNTHITNKPKSKELLDMVRSILYLNGSYCCRCNTTMSKTEVKQCNGCHRMSYCSKACQKEDWLNGHKLACCKSHTDETYCSSHGGGCLNNFSSCNSAAILSSSLCFSVASLTCY